MVLLLCLLLIHNPGAHSPVGVYCVHEFTQPPLKVELRTVSSASEAAAEVKRTSGVV